MMQIVKCTFCRNIFLLFIIICVSRMSSSTSSVFAQKDETYMVDITETSAYFDEDNNVANITGIVRNALAVDILDVEIGGLLIYEGEKFLSGVTNVSKIEAGEFIPFELEIEASNKPASFIVQVLSYRLDTQSIDLLFDYFWMYENDYALHQAVVKFLESPSPDVISQMITRFQIDEPKRGNAQTVLTEDLLMLPVLSKGQTIDVIQALVDKELIYSDQRYQEAFSEMKAEIDDDNESMIPLLNQAHQHKKTLMDLWYDALFSINENDIPELFEKHNSPLREKLGYLYLERGKELRSRWDQGNAIDYLEKAKLYLGDRESIQIEISKAIVREKWLIVLIGIGVVVVTSSIIKEAQKI